MKKILVATDFSDASLNAFLYGIALAEAMHAELSIYHVYKMAQHIPEGYLVHTTPDLWPEIREKMEKMVATADPEHKLYINISGDHGNPAECILKEAVRTDTGLIICGMDHGSGSGHKIFGSTATAIAHKTSIPLLIIPAKASFNGLGHIALACDTDVETLSPTVTMIKMLVEYFSASLSVVLVTDDATRARYDLHFQTLPFMDALKELKPVFEVSDGTDITRSLLNFAVDKKIDLLSVIAHRHSFFDRLIVESVTRKLAFHTHIPLLIMPQVKACNSKCSGCVKEDLVDSTSEQKNK